MATCLDFLKGYLLIGCIFNIGLAVGAIIAGVFIGNLREEFLIYDAAQQVKQYIVIGFYVLGSICALTGILGVFAFWKKIKCFQTLFIIFNIIFFVLYASIFAGLMIAQPHLNKLKNQECQSITQLQDANELFAKDLKPKLCKKGSELNYKCPCHFPDPSKWTTEQFSHLEQRPQEGSIKNIFECNEPKIQNELKSKETEINLLKAIEEEFDCTGICEGDIIFYFSDITRGPPGDTNGCFKPFKDFILKILGGVFIFAVIATVFTFLNVTIGKNYKIHLQNRYYVLDKNILYNYKGFINCCCDRQNTQNQNQEEDKNKNSFEMSSRVPLNNQFTMNRNQNRHL